MWCFALLTIIDLVWCCFLWRRILSWACFLTAGGTRLILSAACAAGSPVSELPHRGAIKCGTLLCSQLLTLCDNIFMKKNFELGLLPFSRWLKIVYAAWAPGSQTSEPFLRGANKKKCGALLCSRLLTFCHNVFMKKNFELGLLPYSRWHKTNSIRSLCPRITS